MSAHFGPRTQKKKKNIGGRIAAVLICFFMLIIFGWKARWPRDLHFPSETRVLVLPGDSISKFYMELPSVEVFRFKRYLRNHPEEFTSILEGSYLLSGTYTASDFLTHLAKWPEQEYAVVRILEGWSIYDIDESLTSKGLIRQGEYISYVTNPDKIAALAERYGFFDANIKSLEGFLYPDTYHIDVKADVVKDLVSMQLNTFKRRIWEEHASDFVQIQHTYGLSVYEVVTLASIIEKEEKADGNKPTVAGIFYNRIQSRMSLGADITLCYYLKQPYANCTPAVIAKHVSDKKNPYNTRHFVGLPPTPIGNAELATFQAVMSPQQTSYLYYLHDAKGEIHYAKTNDEHNRNKVQWL